MILDAYPTILTDPLPQSTKVEKIITVNGLAQKTAEQFVKEIPTFLSFIQSANLLEKLTPLPSQALDKPTLNVNKDHPLYGKKWVMTGFRDKVLIQDLLNVGSEQGTGVNKKTALVIVKDLDEDNVKVSDAKKLGIPIMTPEQVRATYTLS